LTARPIKLNEEELIDVQKRKSMDAIRIEEQKRFYEIARQRAAELDVYMEKFRRDIVESSKFAHISSDMILICNRWLDEAFRRDSRETLHCRPKPAISEIRGVASHRVCFKAIFSASLTD
jgi:hypothetical protein